MIPDKHKFKWNVPIIICGSGPSLDHHIEQLKSIKDNAIILSAGTSLLPLLNNGIIPDFHIEMESDYSVMHSLSSVGDLSILKKIPLITGIQSTPTITGLFKDVFFFVKDSSAVGDLIEKKENKLIDPTPTCVNAALSFAMHYDAESIYLFGTDFGFYDKDKNHSKHSLYNTKTQDTDVIRKRNENNVNNSFKSEGYKGDCFTTNIYFTTKRRIELAITLKKLTKTINIYNCSDGLIINNTTHIEKNDIIKLKEINLNTIKKQYLKNARELDIDSKTQLFDPLINSIKEISSLLIHNINLMNNDIRSLSSLCWSVSNYIAESHIKKHGSLQYFIRGTIWHYLLCGYSISYAVSEIEQSKLIIIWKERFKKFLEILPNQLETLRDRDRDINDKSLKSTIRNELDGF